MANQELSFRTALTLCLVSLMTEDDYEYTQINIVDIICIRFNTYVHGLSSIT